jgi:hypothetical protein
MQADVLLEGCQLPSEAVVEVNLGRRGAAHCASITTNVVMTIAQ